MLPLTARVRVPVLCSLQYHANHPRDKRLIQRHASARLEAGAERTLEGVACTRLFGLALILVPLFTLTVSTKPLRGPRCLRWGFLLLEKKPHFLQKPAERDQALEKQVVLASSVTNRAPGMLAAMRRPASKGTRASSRACITSVGTFT